MHSNFQDYTVSALSQTKNLIITKSGHYAVPCQILSNVTNNSYVNFTLGLENPRMPWLVNFTDNLHMFLLKAS